MNPVMAGVDDTNDFLNPDVSRIIFFLSASCFESASLYRKDNGLKERLITGIERAVYENITLVKVRLTHGHLRLRIAC